MKQHGMKEHGMRAFYGLGGRKGGKGRPGEREHDLVIEVESDSESVIDAEVAAAEAREDVGTVNRW